MVAKLELAKKNLHFMGHPVKFYLCYMGWTRWYI